MELTDEKKFITLGIFAHANAGKTTITENLLHNVNIINSVGKVDVGNTVTDDMSIEQKRGISVRSSLVSFELGNKIIQLVDTPGHIDFSAEVERTISILDAAILVISGADGIEPQTYTIWKNLRKKNIPIIIFINKLDREGAIYEEILKEIKQELDEKCFSLINVKKGKNLEIIKKEKKELSEKICDIDEKSLEIFIKNNSLKFDFLEKRIGELINQKKLFPVIGGSSLRGIGIDKLIFCIKNYLCSFKSNNTKFSAFAYLVRNENNNRNIYTKILSGELNLRENIEVGENKFEKVKKIFSFKNGKIVSVDKAYTGEIVIINGLSINLGDYIGNKLEKIDFSFVNPLIVMEVQAIKKGIIVELVDALKILTDEDPYLKFYYDKQTGKIYINLMGLIQGEVIKELLFLRFGLETTFLNPKVKHKETPSKIGIGKASYTQFSGIEFEITPLKRGTGIIYNSKLSTDYLHKKYQSQAEKLVKKYLLQGLFGWELTDLEISLVNGKFNSAGSNPLHFNIIVPLALFRAIRNSRIKILEPISSFNLMTPVEKITEVIKSLNSREALFDVKAEADKNIILEGQIFTKNIINYNSDIIELTSGKGFFESFLLKYDISRDQNIEMDYYGLDPRNETIFLKTIMKGSLEMLDIEGGKIKKATRSKFKRSKISKK